ncbi:MAG: DUF4097 domain-containing protein [Oscillospiraceae bacterium]|jgi:DUF4097 and DUF4098 domain-containing protein YvlB|nr:DUF4097 domain-containing protein [Oscillospiraceae bacterium]
MKNKQKVIWIIIILTIVAGLTLAVLGFVLGASKTLYLDRSGLHIAGNEIIHIEEYDLEPFKNIHVDVRGTNVKFVASDSFGLEIYSDNTQWEWSQKNDTLIVSLITTTRIQLMSFDFFSHERNYIKIFIPLGTVLDTVSIEANSGSVEIGDLTANSIEVSCRTGNIHINNITSDYLHINTTSGNITGSNLNAKNLISTLRTGRASLHTINTENFSIECTSGSITVTNAEFNNASFKVQTGNITLNDVTSLGLNAQTTSGIIRISGDFSGKSIVQARTGNVFMSTSGHKNDYSFDLSVRTGSITLDGERRSGERTIISGLEMENHIKILTTSGNIDVEFTR